MIFDPPNVALAKFTERHSRKKSITLISPRELKTWRILTKDTDGQFLAKFMAPTLWSDSLGSLQTAVAIVAAYTPENLVPSDAYQTTLAKLRQRIVKEHLRQYVAKHGPVKAQLQRASSGKGKK